MRVGANVFPVPPVSVTGVGAQCVSMPDASRPRMHAPSMGMSVISSPVRFVLEGAVVTYIHVLGQMQLSHLSLFHVNGCIDLHRGVVDRQVCNIDMFQPVHSVIGVKAASSWDVDVFDDVHICNVFGVIVLQDALPGSLEILHFVLVVG